MMPYIVEVVDAATMEVNEQYGPIDGTFWDARDEEYRVRRQIDHARFFTRIRFRMEFEDGGTQ